MAERAYSCELNRDIWAKDAVNMSVKGSLRDERAFRCCDEKCRIVLTCTNWKNSNGKRFYFVPSHNREAHVAGCNAVEPQKESKQARRVRNTTSAIKNNNILTMVRVSDKRERRLDSSQADDELTLNKISVSYKEQNANYDTKQENSRISKMAIWVERYNKAGAAKDSIINVYGKKRSLNSLFISCDTVIENDVFGIFYGSALITRHETKEGMIRITFVNSKFPPIYTNVGALCPSVNGIDIGKYVDTDESVETYFRGTYKKGENKFYSYNDRFYLDLYFQEK